MDSSKPEKKPETSSGDFTVILRPDRGSASSMHRKDLKMVYVPVEEEVTGSEQVEHVQMRRIERGGVQIGGVQMDHEETKGLQM